MKQSKIIDMTETYHLQPAPYARPHVWLIASFDQALFKLKKSVTGLREGIRLGKDTMESPSLLVRRRSENEPYRLAGAIVHAWRHTLLVLAVDATDDEVT